MRGRPLGREGARAGEGPWVGERSGPPVHMPDTASGATAALPPRAASGATPAGVVRPGWEGVTVATPVRPGNPALRMMR